MRIDEFKKTPAGSFTRQDLVRFWSIGFDIAPVIPTFLPAELLKASVAVQFLRSFANTEHTRASVATDSTLTIVLNR